jgi:hypothetical protein
VRKTFSFVEEPKGETYRALVDYAATRCDKVLLVVRGSLPLDPSAEAALNRLSAYLHMSSDRSEWPGTTLISGTARVLQYRLSEGCAAALKECAVGLYSWRQPLLPEDLCFLRSDGSPFLVSIAHERDGYLELSEAEMQRLLADIPRLGPLLGT